MKNIVIFAFVFLHFQVIESQTCDIYTTGFAPVKTELITGESVDLVFSIKNDAKGVACAYKEGSVSVYLFLPESELFFERVLSPVNGHGTFFDWLYDPENRTLIGRNHTAISDGQGEEEIRVRLKVGRILSKQSKKTVGLSIVQHPDGAIFPSNDQSNDNSILTMTLRPDISQQTVQLAVHNKDCNSIDLSFLSGLKGTVERIEINRTEDGKTYLKVGSWLPGSTGENVTVSVSDTEGLETGKTYTYELVVWRADGQREMLVTETIYKECKTEKPDMLVYPNPAVDKIFVQLTGEWTENKADLIFTNARGELVKIVENVSKDQNEVSLTGLPSGIYFVGVKGVETINHKRIVKIDK